MAIENTVSSDFDPRSSIVKGVFGCCLSCGVLIHFLIVNEKFMIIIFTINELIISTNCIKHIRHT